MINNLIYMATPIIILIPLLFHFQSILRKVVATISLVISLYPSVRPHGTEQYFVFNFRYVCKLSTVETNTPVPRHYKVNKY
jgi:hypothetical protein